MGTVAGGGSSGDLRFRTAIRSKHARNDLLARLPILIDAICQQHRM